jgi:hypothetical protein
MEVKRMSRALIFSIEEADFLRIFGASRQFTKTEEGLETPIPGISEIPIVDEDCKIPALEMLEITLVDSQPDHNDGFKIIEMGEAQQDLSRALNLLPVPVKGTENIKTPDFEGNILEDISDMKALPPADFTGCYKFADLFGNKKKEKVKLKK